MTKGENIRRIRQSKKISQAELAEAIGAAKQTIYKYEKGIITNIPSDNIEAIATALGVSPADIMGWDEKSNIGDVVTDEIRMIPVFENVSAGFGAYADSEVMDYVPLFVRNPSEVPNLMGIRVRGDSMYPKIEDGDIIIVRKQTSVDSGSIAVILLDGEEGLVKKVEYGDDWIDLISINPEYKPRRFEGEEVTRLQVVGLVKQVIKML